MLDNIQIFFSVLVLVFFIGMMLVSYKYKKSLIYLLVLFILSLVLLNIDYWYISSIGILLILFPLIYKKIDQYDLISSSMIGSILGSYFLFNLFVNYKINYLMIIISIILIIMCLLSVLGILEKNINKYLIYSNLIQFSFVIVDLSVAKYFNRIDSLGIIQIFNYVLAGSLFFITLIMLNKDKSDSFKDIQGYYYKDHITGVFAIIACVSLAGLPGLNIFVSEWMLFVKSLSIDPAITVIGIFIALLLFIMYFKVIYILISNFKKEKLQQNILSRIYVIILGSLCLLFGIIFYLQFYIFDKVL